MKYRLTDNTKVVDGVTLPANVRQFSFKSKLGLSLLGSTNEAPPHHIY
jgi:hypothetical protein